MSVRAWRRRFADQGFEAWGVSRWPGPQVMADGVAAVAGDTLHNKPDDGSTHRTTRFMAERHGIGQDTAARIRREHGCDCVSATRSRSPKTPPSGRSSVNVVGLFLNLNRPERAVVFSSEEKTRCQALGRSRPGLPLKPGQARTMTHDCKWIRMLVPLPFWLSPGNRVQSCLC